MQGSVLSPLSTPIQEQIGGHGHLIILVLTLILTLVFFIPATSGDSIHPCILNPIGNVTGGEPITINGTTTNEQWKQIGIEIFPKQYWDFVCAFGKESSGKVVFNLITSSAENFDPSCINLVRFNADGTRTAQVMNITPDHVLITGPVEKTVLALKHWSIQIERNDAGSPLSPGTYHVNVWDATNQKPDYDNPYPNGWDVVDTKIYPSTGRINRWDEANRREMLCAEFSIQ